MSIFLNEQQKKPDHLYRSGVGVMLINAKKEIFVGKRIDNHSDAWQMPQGGIDSGEEEDHAMFRELKEETGINKEKIGKIIKSQDYYYYNLPYKLQKKFWGGKFLGQKQRWYLLEFIGSDEDVNIKTPDPEFCEWKWVNEKNLLNSIVDFKREMYAKVVLEFSKYL
jgi:putative (di)nucleoside polyphosphate hydrolase